MAVTKLLHLKQSKGNFPSGSLIRCLHYIYNKEKTEDGLWTGSNCGRTAKEVYRAMMDTKYEWGKEWGRQGYHFIVAFEKGETDEQTACQVMKEWCQEYLGDQYEYAYAVHNDREHLHGHLVFNSVSRTSGRKYRYEKGDWKKYIQPVTDRICERHGLHRLTYQPPAKGEHYAEHMSEQEGRPTWKTIIQQDIDAAISKSETYEEVQQWLRKRGYQIREGYSKEHGEYATLCPPGAKRGRRTYKLSEGYRVADIRYRVSHKEEEKPIRTVPYLKTNMELRRSGSGTFRYSRYQVRAVRRCYRATHYRFLNPYRVNQGQVRKDLLMVSKLSRSCRYLLQSRITTEEELRERFTHLREEERTIRKQESVWNQEGKQESNELTALREEKKLIRFLLKEGNQETERVLRTVPETGQIRRVQKTRR